MSVSFTERFLTALPSGGGGVTYPTTVTNHVRAGNLQHQIAPIGFNTFDVVSNITESTFESIGPTASGADNIWTPMDVLPAGATVLIVGVLVTASPNSAARVDFDLYCAQGDDATPDTIDATRTANLIADANENVGSFGSFVLAYIPLGATNQDFLCTWEATNDDDRTCFLDYRGFIAE